MKNTLLSGFLLLLLALSAAAQEPLLNPGLSRKTTSLNGTWQYIIDPYETGYYDYRFRERSPGDPEAYWNRPVQKSKTDRKEHGYTDRYTLQVPGDWNAQDPKFLYYEGTVWYQRSFDYAAEKAGNRVFLYFGAVNYAADVYLNGKKLGRHTGGFTPFNFEIPQNLLLPKDNFLVVRVDNKRSKEEVPTVNTDWWNYGGITRSVELVEVPPAYIQNFSVQLKKGAAGKKPNSKKAEISGWVQLAEPYTGNLTVEIPELKVKKQVAASGTEVSFTLPVSALQLWSPQHPKRYEVILRTAGDVVTDKIGFRTIETAGEQLLLNGEPLFLRGICAHAEIGEEGRRAQGKEDALKLLGKAAELGCNMLRLTHYPHDESIIRAADSLGFVVWSEIPVYWTIDFTSKAVYEKAKTQLGEMITRDRNRASIIIWSVGNETPVSPVRTEFMRNLIAAARQMDSTRLVSAALEVHYASGKDLNLVDDPLGAYVDIVSFNEYLGWYGKLPSACRTTNWNTPYNKPLFISETGGGAKAGFHGDSLTIFSEEYQEWYYREQVAMLQRMPAKFVGLAPWVLTDFRSPKRNNPMQDGWNRKGLYSEKGEKKKAFYVLKDYYERMKQQEEKKKQGKAGSNRVAGR
ncbi:glycoside hydrolase family 2 TIM barrel-domain containing protein [Paraflavisolibacter sp. H34]|uniref:glycoside hydrolase family 2 protein n=1 Tax=Huijunlia imazamoxiresistens TaxID=3127457 RepID=UPI003019B5F3